MASQTVGDTHLANEHLRDSSDTSTNEVLLGLREAHCASELKLS